MPKPLVIFVAVYCGAILYAVNASYSEKELKINSAEERRQEKKGFDEPLQFLNLHKELRTPDDQLAPSYKAGYKLLELNQALSHANKPKGTVARTKSATFTERGPANVPGRTRALFNVPHASNSIWLAGAATGGIWKTSNGGSTWTEKNGNLTALPISSFGADKNAVKIYAGTGEYISSVFSATGDGIFVSNDKGETWSPINTTQGNPDFSIITRLIVHPDNPDLIVVTTAPSTINASKNTSFIMRSANGGATWSKVKTIEGVFEQIIFEPGNFDVQYASQKDVGVWKSTNAGLTWNLSNKGMDPSGRLELAVSPVNPKKVFASAEGGLSGAESDLYVSDDAGETWSLVELKFNNQTVDFLGSKPNEDDSQGFYDNTILCDPFNENVIYVGGVNLFQVTLGSAAGSLDTYYLQEVNTQSFLFLQSFSNIQFDNGRLTVGSNANKIEVELRFGAGIKQKAHRFLVPENRTSGVATNEYVYQSYVDVPFEVWDVTGNRQLMVSFRDQNRNGIFDLVTQYLTSEGIDYLLNSREYIFIHDENYSDTQHSSIAQNGGQEFKSMYSFFPCLINGATWNAANLPSSKIIVKSSGINKFNSTVVTVADAYRNFDSKNPVNQQNLDQGMHPDHHFMLPVSINESAKTYSILLGNDGGVFVSNASTSPGTTNGSWNFKGFGYNTSQFYGADKKPKADQYIGGMQDNGTRVSPSNTSASASTAYQYAIGGDGFEVIWNNKDADKILGTIYNGQIMRSTNGGATWNLVNGISAKFPFVTKLANSKDLPDRVFTISSDGVYVSENFGSSWNLTPIAEKLVTNSVSMLDVEVSRANANIVWAGSGMSNINGFQRNLFVSTDGGKTFTATNNFTTVTLGSITKLASHPAEPNTAYALFSFAGRPKILRTKNLGQTWEDISGFGTSASSNKGFPDVAVFCLYVRPDNPDIIWAGTEIGIVESQDNGQSWSLMVDFPKVAVWDMKGQDNQVVIATHGRGIWTATVDSPQSDFLNIPEIVTAGTNPKGELAIRLKGDESFDSLQVLINNNNRLLMKPVVTGEFDITLSSGAGNRSIKLISYKNGAPFQSDVFFVNHLSLLETGESYATYFNSIADFALNGFSLQNFGATPNIIRTNLQTLHPYAVNQTYTASLRKPIKINATLPVLYYADVALVEPAHAYVVAEATKNGLDWEALSEPYDASANADWHTAFTKGEAGKHSMLNKKEFDITTKFSVGDTLLFRWRLFSGPDNTAWGWAIDYIAIQEVPVETESLAQLASLTAFPNPTSGVFSIRYQLNKPAKVTTQLVDITGRTMSTHDLGFLTAGEHTEILNLENHQPGTYLLILQLSAEKYVLKVIRY